MSRRIAFGVVCLALPFLSQGAARSQDPAKPAESSAFAGPTENGFLLPNGWRLTPAGRQVVLTDLPLNIVPSPDSRYAFVATSGYNVHELTAVELASGNKVAAEKVAQSWFGLAADKAVGRFWWSGGGEGALQHFAWADGKVQAPSSPGPESPEGPH